jgi:hypothetical protein
MELLEKRTCKLEERLNTAEVRITQLMASNPLRVNSMMKTKRKLSEGGYKCLMGWALLMLCIIYLVSSITALSAMPSTSQSLH